MILWGWMPGPHRDSNALRHLGRPTRCGPGQPAAAWPRDRERAGREASPTAAVTVSQSVKITESGGLRGHDAGKTINGRKRHAMVDTHGRGLTLDNHPASIQDRDSAPPLMRASRQRWPFEARLHGQRLSRRSSESRRETLPHGFRFLRHVRRGGPLPFLIPARHLHDGAAPPRGLHPPGGGGNPRGSSDPRSLLIREARRHGRPEEEGFALPPWDAPEPPRDLVLRAP
jgi:hypothetical protein